MASTVELIKERLAIADVIGSYIKLEKAGINLKARCPFHNEKTPSFMVSPVRGGYYCFGCGEKGDMFTFVEKYEGIDFKGALKILADKAGVPIVYDREEKSDKDPLFKVMEATTSYFESNLEKTPAVQKYLKERGLKEKIITEFRLGYAKNEWRDLLSHLRQKGFKDSDIELSGLIKKSEEAPSKDYYDRFRGRIMFPIGDPSGRVIAFSGRIFDKPKNEEKETAKYINSPEAPIFSKSKVLYGYDKAKEGIRKWGFTILVEGQMDLLMSHQALFRNTVALSGTALTNEHLSLISRLSNRLVLALDADRAGLAASGKSAALALSRGLDVKVARLPLGKDPADLVKTDPQLWKKSIREASHIIDFYLEVISSFRYDERKFRQEVSREVIPYVARVQNAIDKAHFISVVAAKLRLPESAVEEEVLRVTKETEGEISQKSEPGSGDEKISKSESLINRLLGLIISETNYKKGKFNVVYAEEKISEIVGSDIFSKAKARASVTPTILFEGEELYDKEESLESEIDELILNLKQHTLKQSFERVMHELREKEKAGLTKEAADLLNKCHELSREIAKIDLLLRK